MALVAESSEQFYDCKSAGDFEVAGECKSSRWRLWLEFGTGVYCRTVSAGALAIGDVGDWL